MGQSLEERIETAIALAFEGQGEAWSDELSGDRLAAVAAQAAMTVIPDADETPNAKTASPGELAVRKFEYRSSPHFRAQVERAYPAYVALQGTKNARSLEDFIDNCADLAAVLDVTGGQRTANVGGLSMEKVPYTPHNFHLHLWAAEVYTFQMEHGPGEQEARDRVHQQFAEANAENRARGL